jgi:hypothetical protein
MKKLISLKLALVLLLSSLTSLGPISIATAATSSCENGECIDKLIDKLEDLGTVYSQECLPSQGSKTSLKSYHEENGLTEQCWKLITEINHLEAQLQKHQTKLEERLGCQGGDCKLANSEESLNSQISELTKVEQNLSCTIPKKQAIKAQCPSDMNCVLAATAMGVGGYLAELLVPAKVKPKGCHLGDDSCLTQLATGFLKAAISFFEGAWDLLKIVGKKAGQKMTQFWNWVSGAENHSSTSQLAMAKASKDAGVFDMLVNDFPGTMKKIWAGFVGSMKEWLKTDIFCQKWSGVPHFSTCQKPTESFDCIPCKTMVSGLCAVTGTLVAEVVPSFLTGGLITAAKHGANGAVKIAKIFRISNKGIKAIKASRVAKIAVAASTKVDDVLRLSKGLTVAKAAVSVAMKAISRYLLSPTRKMVKSSLAVLTAAMKQGTAYVAVTPVGKTIVFSGKALKMTGKVIIYPIDNPLTTWAFKAGERSFEKVFKLGAPKLASQGAVATTLISNEKGIHSLLAKVEEAKIVKPKAKDLLKLEQELLEKVGPKRQAILMEALKDDSVNLEDVIKHLYPELQYGDLAKKLTPQQILAAEKELWLEISKMPDGPARNVLTKRYNSHVIQGEARLKVVGDSSPTYKQIIDNSNLGKDERLSEALKLLKRESLDPADKTKLAKALEEAHLAGPDNGVFEYSWAELREKYRILIDGGFSKDEADILIRSGLAGRPPVRELIKPGDTLFSGFAEDIVDARYLQKKEELTTLILAKNPVEQKNLAQKIFGFLGKNSEVNPGVTITDNFDSLYFVDYQHSVSELDNFLNGSKTVKASAMSAQYEKEAFENFKDARKYLLTEKPAMNKETLLEVHKRMMKGGVENVPEADMGVIRSGSWYGNVPSDQPIDDAILKEINKNPYLTWIETQNLGNGNYAGQIQYPNVTHIKKEGIDLLRKNHKDLVLEIEEYQGISQKILSKEEIIKKASGTPEGLKALDELNILKKRRELLVKNKAVTTKKIVDAMVDDLMDWFTRERTLIGEINSPEKLDQFVNLTSKFQRDMVSIHPLANGNGRSTREFALSYALMREGFPPPRILDPNADIYRSLEEWQKIIKHGILASDFLVDDMVERLKFGLPIENSVELITPYTRPPVQMALKGQKKVPFMEGVEYIDPRLYREIIKREIASNPALKVEFANNPVAAWDKIHKKAEEIFAKNNLYYNHPKKGIERVSLGIVDEDFKILYGKASFNNKELFDFKMKTWYSEDITWRGLASKHAEKSEGEIINMFEELTSHNASNHVVKKVGGNATPEAIRKAALEDFDKYNSDVFGDGLVQMAKDHSETGPMYGISYGYSTSKSRDVGKAFAQGAMVVGEYGQHKAPELQALLKSRVLVGARRANKDVDLGRLKQLKDEFSYKYGRQQEVMGIGASDPDAITIVQTLDAEGEVMLSYLRNKKNPKEILVIKGDIDPDGVPTADQIAKTILLGSK